MSNKFVPYRPNYDLVAKRALKTGGLGDITAGYTTLYDFVNSLAQGTIIHANGWNPPTNLTDLPPKPQSNVGVSVTIIKGANSSIFYDSIVLRYTESQRSAYHEYHGYLWNGAIEWAELSFVQT